MKQVILKGPRATLRSIKLFDAPNYVRWFKDKDVVKYLNEQTPISLKKEKLWIKNLKYKKEEFNWSIIVTGTNKHIGSVGLRLVPKDKRANFGIIIGDKNEWGKGYATECLSLLLDYVFQKLRYNRLDLDVYSENKRAIRAYEKCNFFKEGVERQYRWNRITKKFDDSVIMSILREEWMKTSK